MDKEIRYTLTKEELLKIFSDAIGKNVVRVRLSPRNQTAILEVRGNPDD